MEIGAASEATQGRDIVSENSNLKKGKMVQGDMPEVNSPDEGNLDTEDESQSGNLHKQTLKRRYESRIDNLKGEGLGRVEESQLEGIGSTGERSQRGGQSDNDNLQQEEMWRRNYWRGDLVQRLEGLSGREGDPSSTFLVKQGELNGNRPKVSHLSGTIGPITCAVDFGCVWTSCSWAGHHLWFGAKESQSFCSIVPWHLVFSFVYLFIFSPFLLSGFFIEVVVNILCRCIFI